MKDFAAGKQVVRHGPQGSVKVAGVAYRYGHACITRDETPHPPPCGPPSPQGRETKIKITALSPRERVPDGGGQVRGPFEAH
jgi:hypothetical protein